MSTCHVFTGPAEAAKLNWFDRTACLSTQQLEGVRGHASQGNFNFSKFDALRLLLRQFFDPSSVSSVALGRLDSDSTKRLHVVLASFPDPTAAQAAKAEPFAQPRQATNVTARAKPCYINPASPALSLQATSTYIFEHVAAQKLVQPWPEQPDRLCVHKTCCILPNLAQNLQILQLYGMSSLNL